MTVLKAACVQMSASTDVDTDIAQNIALINEATDAGATLIATPEFCVGLDVAAGALAPVAFPEAEHPALAAFQDVAKTRKVDLIVGSIAVVEAGKLFNRSFHIDSTGSIKARYDKIHMFDIDLGADGRYCESDVMEPGSQAAMTQIEGAFAGLSICYDLRFPHLYRHYAKSGAQILFIPAAFTKVTGEAHWMPLLRARAIENGAFVIAPGQCGAVKGAALFGHSVIIDPWGKVLAEAGDATGFVAQDIDLDLVTTARGKIPSLENEREFAV